MGGNKNIVLITSGFPYGGASANLLRYFVFCLKEVGHNIEVFQPTGAYYGKKLDQQSVRQGNIGGVNYRRLCFIHHPRNYLGKILDNFLGLLLTFLYLLKRKLANRLDLIIVYDTSFSASLIHVLSKLLLAKKLIIILPEFYERPDSKPLSLSMLKWYNFYFGIKYIARHADKIIVLSSYLKTYMELRLKSHKDILIMPNLTDPTRFNITNIKNFKNDCITIGYVGTPGRKDGIFDLIRSFGTINKKNPKTHLLIIGDLTNGDTIVPQLRKYALDYGIDENSITFTGLTSHIKIPGLLLSCQICIITRPNGVFAEAGFPTKLGEYFACRKPVVITRIGDMQIYFKDKEHVVFAEPENIDSIVRAIEYLINNPIKANEIGINGYKWMDENLNFINQSKKISKFLNGEP